MNIVKQDLLHKKSFWKFYEVKGGFQLMLILGLLCRYVLWCCGSICKEDFTFIQIGSGHTVLRHKTSRVIGRNQNEQTRYRRDQNSVMGKNNFFNNFPAHLASTAPKSKIRHYSSWTWINRLNYWCTNYKHKINWNPDGIIYILLHTWCLEELQAQSLLWRLDLLASFGSMFLEFE